jgi:hypothetical protein
MSKNKENAAKVRTLVKSKIPASKAKAKVKAKAKGKIETQDANAFTLTGVSAVKVILSQYVKNRKKVEVFDAEMEEDGLEMTIVSPDDISITDLLHEKSKRAYYFLDARKTQIKLWPIMIDVTLEGALPAHTAKLCWWDHHQFENRPIGCPLRCIYPTKPKEKVNLKSVGPQASRPQEKDETPITVVSEPSPGPTYETEGYFCSFPCCKAYIISRKAEIKYKESLSLLTMMFMSFYDGSDGSETKIESIPVAPTWKILKEYGGHLTIQEYKSSIGKLEYEETINFKRSTPKAGGSGIVSSSQYIQEKRSKIFKKN